MDYLTIRKIQHSLQVISHPRGLAVRVQKERAGQIVLQYLRQNKRQNDFFGMMRATIHLFLRIQRGLKDSVRRKMLKKEVLREYWQGVLDRCKLLTNRGLTDQIKKFNGHKFGSISGAQRHNLINRCVYLQEVKYVEKVVEWRAAVAALTGQNHKKICSRLLKYFMDDYLLNRRSRQEELAIIATCIDANIPVPEEKINIQLKRGKTMAKAKKAGAADVGRGTERSAREEEKRPVRTSSTQRKDIYSISQDKMRESLAFVGQAALDADALDGSRDGSDIDFTAAGLELQGAPQASQRRRSAVLRDRLAASIQRAHDLDFLLYLQSHALTPPSLEFLPDFNNFVNIMQQGVFVQESPTHRRKKPLLKSSKTIKLKRV